MEQQIIYIPVDRLLSHPENPRKDLGDLAELADSIRQKGVLQNLTVVPIDRENPYTSYTVVIGHRRMAAAKMAGLTSLPCVVTEMTYQEQLETMLLENMQRTDLTVYEQALGFQQLSMLGADVQSISQKTGFSPATVRRRLKMAALNHDTLKEIADRQIPLSDFDRLYEIEDPAVQNECLKVIGTANFDQKVAYQLKKQNCAKMLPKVREVLKKLKANKISRSESYGGKYDRASDTISYDQWNGESPLFKDVPSGKKIFYLLDEDFGHVTLYVAAERAKPKKRTAEEIEHEKKIEETWNRADETVKIHYELRKHFIENLSVTTRNFDHVMEGALVITVYASVSWISSNSVRMHELLGTSEVDYDHKTRAAITAAKTADPSKLAKIIYCAFDDDEKNGYVSGYRKRMPECTNNLPLDMLYDWLVKLGYEMSDDEKAMRDGTYQFTQSAEVDDPVDEAVDELDDDQYDVLGEDLDDGEDEE